MDTIVVIYSETPRRFCIRDRDPLVEVLYLRIMRPHQRFCISRQRPTHRFCMWEPFRDPIKGFVSETETYSQVLYVRTIQRPHQRFCIWDRDLLTSFVCEITTMCWKSLKCRSVCFKKYIGDCRWVELDNCVKRSLDG